MVREEIIGKHAGQWLLGWAIHGLNQVPGVFDKISCHVSQVFKAMSEVKSEGLGVKSQVKFQVPEGKSHILYFRSSPNQAPGLFS